VLAYIYEQYSGDKRCKDNSHLAKLNLRVEGFKRLAIGTLAPEVNLVDISGKPVSIENAGSPYVVLIFWATWCPHCTEELPDLQKMYLKQKIKNWEVIAVSLDTNKIEWMTFVEKGAYTWPNCAELLKWEGKTVLDYYVYATPSIFLLGKDRKIYAKPKSVKELARLLKDMGI
jgi:peroxiredoxin